MRTASGELALEGEVEMAGPHQGLADVGRRDGVGRWPVIPSIEKDTGLLSRRTALLRSTPGDGCSAAENTKRGKQDGQNAVLRATSSSMRGARPIIALYQNVSGIGAASAPAVGLAQASAGVEDGAQRQSFPRE